MYYSLHISLVLQFPLTSAPQKTNQSGRDAWNKKLIVWYFEDQLKQRYERFVVELQVSRSFRPRVDGVQMKTNNKRKL